MIFVLVVHDLEPKMIRQRAPNIEIPISSFMKIFKMKSGGNDIQIAIQKPQDGISSTLIQNVILDGEMRIALESVSRPHKIEGVVVSGMQARSENRFSDRKYFQNKLIPSTGVYAVFVKLIRTKTTEGDG